MQPFISQLVKDESGTTAIEYALIGALITVVLHRRDDRRRHSAAGNLQCR